MMSCGELARILSRAAAEASRELTVPTKKVMVDVSELAKGYIGSYQPGWAPLAETTLNGWHGFPGKIELGYAPPDNPLLRDGSMRASIDSQAEPMGTGAIGVVGSNSPIALYQEMGTSRGIPPRPFLGLAMHHSEEYATPVFGEYAVKLLTVG